MLKGTEFENESNFEYVSMPWDDKTEIVLQSNWDCNEIVTRWKYIQKEFRQIDKITCPSDLIELIKSYNVVHDATGRQSSPPWKFTALLRYFHEISESERNDFFKSQGILGTITNLVLQSVELVPRVKLLKSGVASCITLHQIQIASLLANAFMCTYPNRDADYPYINFNKLFEGPGKGHWESHIEKIKCLVHYFWRIHEKQPTGSLSFHRLCIPDDKLPRWDKTTASLCGLKVEIQGSIEKQQGFLQMDFANRFVGGGVLGRGCVQEEIRFIICPELIAARLFTQCLADNEALFVIGAERYCKHRGFSSSFRFEGDYIDTTEFDDSGHRKTYVIVLDALYFSHPPEQYRQSKILRELKKAYVGFKPLSKSLALPIATGNWGCGAFHGDPQLKSMVQLMAASQARRDLLYLTFGDSLLKKQIDEMYKLLKEREINVGTLYRIIRQYNRNRNKNQTLFEFIEDTIISYRKRMTVTTSVVRKEPDSSKIIDEMESDYGSVDKRLRKFPIADVTASPDLEMEKSARDENDFHLSEQGKQDNAGRSQDDSTPVKVSNGRKLVQPKITDCFFKK